MLLSADGAQLYANNTTPAGNFSFQLNVGELSNDLKELKIAILSVDTPGHLENKPSFIGKLGYENTSGSTRLAFSYADADMEYKPGSGDFLDSGDLNFKIFLFSAQQNIGAFTLTGEYLRQENIFENFGPFYPKATPTSESYYIQGDYHFNNRFKGYTRYDALFLNKDDRTGKHYPPNIPSSTALPKITCLGCNGTHPASGLSKQSTTVLMASPYSRLQTTQIGSRQNSTGVCLPCSYRIDFKSGQDKILL